MNSSILDGFQVVDSPLATRRINLDEFSAACTPLQSAYCRQMSETQFESIGESETEKELKKLIEFLDENPKDFIKLVRKRKIEELENAGIFSSLKCKLMTKWKGEEYVDGLVSSDEYQQRLQELTNGMMVVHNYAKETRRCSARLAEKRSKSTCESNCTETPILKRRAIHSVISPSPSGLQMPAFLPPPPPPPPLPDCILPTTAPLKEKNGIHTISKSLKQCSSKLKKISSSKLKPTATVQSIQEELKSADPIKRLRSTQVPRSPGGTPIYNSSKATTRIQTAVDRSAASLSWKSPLDSPEPLHAALIRIFEQKFRNVRSPSPSSSLVNSPSSQPFSP